MYGIIARIQTMEISAPKDLLFPYLKEIKSAIELILLTLEILMILLLMTIQAGIIIIGPM